jgi:hypothetical protein
VKAGGKQQVAELDFFSPEDGSDMFLRYIGRLSTDYAMLYVHYNLPCENRKPYI